MAYTFPEGAKFLFSPMSTFGPEVKVSAISNGDPPVCTAAGHTFKAKDELLLFSPWEDLTNIIYRADDIKADAFSLLDQDTTELDLFSPNGGDNSTVHQVGTWIEIPQVLTIDFQGGDTRFTDVNPISLRNGLSFPTGFNPTKVMIDIGFDQKNPVQKQMVKISRVFQKVAFKLQMLGGAACYGFGNMSASENPKMAAQQVNTRAVAFSLLGRLNSY